MTRRTQIAIRTAIGGAWALLLVCQLAADAAAACAKPDALGTARELAIDARTFPRIGRKHFPDTLPLEPKEVVLTFDDGPFPPTTSRILDALAQECVHATFFLIGRNAAANPQLVRRIVEAGHSIGDHSWSHPLLARMPIAAALDQIDRGHAAVETALRASGEPTQPLRFFRFPGFTSSPELLKRMEARGVTVFGADLWASDWDKMTPEQQLAQITARLDAAGSGIILMHDIKAQTAAMLPAFLRYLKEHHYRVVHVVASGDAAASVAPPAENARPVKADSKKNED